MKAEQIEQLLEKYFSGSTTLEEEALLRAYFNSGTVADSLLPYQALFRFFEDESQEQLSEGFDHRLLQEIATPAPRIRRLRPVLARVAAAALLLLAAWWFYPRPEAPPAQAGIDWSKYEPKTPEEAYRITRMALLRVSGELNNGAAKAADEMEHLRELGRFVK